MPILPPGGCRQASGLHASVDSLWNKGDVGECPAEVGNKSLGNTCGCFPNPHYPVPKSPPSLSLSNPGSQEDGVESWAPEGSLYELLEKTSPLSFSVPCTITMGCLVDPESGVNHLWGRADPILNYHLLKEVR